MTDENPGMPSPEHPTLGELSDYEAGVLTARPSKALLAELLEVIRAERAAARRERTSAVDLAHARDDAVADRDRWRDAKAPDPEAEALAGCVRAIEAMQETKRQADRNRSMGTAYYGEAVAFRSERPEALGMAEGRILLSLAARFGVPIEPTPPTVRPAGEQMLVSVPAHVAEQLQHLPMVAFE